MNCHHWKLTYFFLSGEDPLIDDQNEHDINSVAGVLKLYFRGLENPIFPKERFLDFISTISESRTTENIQSHHSRECTGRIEKRKHTLQFLKYSALLKKRKACSAAHGSNLNTRAPCLIFNRKPVGRGESGPHQSAVCKFTKIISPLFLQ